MKKPIPSLSVLALLLGAALFPVSASTNVSGIISQNTVWSLSGSPYIVTGNVVVTAQAVLTIDTGVIVRFNKATTILVNGELRAIGTPTAKILFTSNQARKNPGDWDRVILSASAVPLKAGPGGAYISGCMLKHAVMEYGGAPDSGSGGMLQVEGGAPGVSHSEFAFSSSFGVKVTADITLDSCVIRNNHFGVYAQGGHFNLRNCRVQDNNLGGVDILAPGCCWTYSTLTNCVIRNNGGIGVSGCVSLFGNKIMGNKSLAVRTDGAPLTITNNIIIGNSGGIMEGDPSSVISDNIIAGNSGDFAYHGRCSFSHNLVYGNTTPGNLMTQYCYNDTNLMSYNTVTANVTEVTLLADDGGYGRSTFLYNNLANNTVQHHDLTLNFPTSTTLNARNNWWGTSADSLIQRKIWDYLDDGTLGFVDYLPYATAPVTQAPVAPPLNVTKQAHASGVQLSWSANTEADIKGYKVYCGNPTGYSFSRSIDVGRAVTYLLTGASITDTVAVTAYDSSLTGTEDQVKGFESWFAVAGPRSTTEMETARSMPLAPGLVIAPNPFHGITRISMRGLDCDRTLGIFDIRGRQVLSFKIKPGQILAWDAGRMAEGVYCARIMGMGTAASKLLVVQR